MHNDARIKPAWWTLILVAALGVFFFTTGSLFAGTFRTFVPVTLMSDRAGLVMETGAKVKLHGVEVGRVSAIHGGASAVSLQLEIAPDQIKFIDFSNWLPGCNGVGLRFYVAHICVQRQPLVGTQ